MIDPWGGSYFVEALTQALMKRAWAHIQEIESLGGMAKAIETGLPKLRIEEAAARRQARIDSGKEAIIGVNMFRLEKAEKLDVREVDNTAVRESQIQRLQKLKAERDNAEGPGRPRRADPQPPKPARAICWRSRLKPPAPAPRWARFPSRLKKSFDRHKAVIRSVSGVYQSEFGQDPQIEQVRQTDRRVRQEARPPSAHPHRQDGPGRP